MPEDSRSLVQGVALLSPSAQGLQLLLDTMQAFCVTNGLTISIPKTGVLCHQRAYNQHPKD